GPVEVADDPADAVVGGDGAADRDRRRLVPGGPLRRRHPLQVPDERLLVDAGEEAVEDDLDFHLGGLDGLPLDEADLADAADDLPAAPPAGPAGVPEDRGDPE